MQKTTHIPTQHIGPVKIIIAGAEPEDIIVPLATFESPLWPSTNRGARVSVVEGGIKTTLLDDRMTRSIVLSAPDAAYALQVREFIAKQQKALAGAAQTGSRFAKLIGHHTQIIGNLFYLRLDFTTGDASGHNMATQGADHVINWLLNHFSQLTYCSISANLCTDKKVSAINAILGRGKSIVAEITISRKTCARYLKTTPEKMVELNIQKNLVGSILAGSLRSANSHYANLLLAIYLATGQDAANIVEGSQGITFARVVDEDLYFSVSLPNIIVGTVGNGKDISFVQENLSQLGCLEARASGKNAQRLAHITAATVLCGELSCLAAQTNLGELASSHLRLERNKGEACA